MRSIFGRFYNFVGSHNHARRYQTHLPLNISLLDSKKSARGNPCRLNMSGYVRDISQTGLSLVVPSVRLGNRYLTDGSLPLEVQVEMPDGRINIQVVPVRYDMFEENQAELRYAIGARIIKIADADRKRLFEYLEQASKRKALTPQTSFAHDAHSF